VLSIGCKSSDVRERRYPVSIMLSSHRNKERLIKPALSSQDTFNVEVRSKFLLLQLSREAITICTTSDETPRDATTPLPSLVQYVRIKVDLKSAIIHR
jgi:hypothetical protein